MYEKPLPSIDADSAPFWQAAREERLALPYCGDCGQAHFPPRALCPHCHGGTIEWRDASGEGVIYTYTIARRGAGAAFKDMAPYVIALIDLAEGPRMMSNIVTDDVETVRIGAAVRVVFDAVTEAVTLPKFELV
jgi:hypothetical protein